MCSIDNPGSAGGMHTDQDSTGYQQGGGRGFGYNRGAFRGRGFPVRPGMGRGFEHGPPPGDMGRGGPWMGKRIGKMGRGVVKSKKRKNLLKDF